MHASNSDMHGKHVFQAFPAGLLLLHMAMILVRSLPMQAWQIITSSVCRAVSPDCVAPRIYMMLPPLN